MAESKEHGVVQDQVLELCSRLCPSPRNEERPLITHRIEVASCLQRQRENYHKCHRCSYQGQAADFVLPESQDRAGTKNGAPRTPELRTD